MKDVFDRPGAGLSGEVAKIPAFARICRHRRTQGLWQYSPAPGFRGVISREKNCQLFIEKPREFIGIYRIIQNMKIKSLFSSWL